LLRDMAEKIPDSRGRRQRSAVETAAWMLVLVLSALILGLTFAHVLELPQRLHYSAELWMRLTQPNALYRYFGLVGGPLEVAAVLSLAGLATAVRRRRSTGRFAIAAAAMHAAALGTWLAVVAPANVEIGHWTVRGIPSDWEYWRIRWESGHAASFALLLTGFCLLVAAVLLDNRRRTS
jgi:hypothetical protein